VAGSPATALGPSIVPGFRENRPAWCGRLVGVWQPPPFSRPSAARTAAALRTQCPPTVLLGGAAPMSGYLAAGTSRNCSAPRSRQILCRFDLPHAKQSDASISHPAAANEGGRATTLTSKKWARKRPNDTPDREQGCPPFCSAGQAQRVALVAAGAGTYETAIPFLSWLIKPKLQPRFLFGGRLGGSTGAVRDPRQPERGATIPWWSWRTGPVGQSRRRSIKLLVLKENGSHAGFFWPKEDPCSGSASAGARRRRPSEIVSDAGTPGPQDSMSEKVRPARQTFDNGPI